MTFLRTLLIGMALVAGTPAGAAGPALPGVPPEGRLDFSVRKSGAEIGHHRIRFSENNGDLIVEIEAALRVRVAFVTVYRYAQRTRETWRDGALIALESDIDDNGQPFKIKAEKRYGKLLVNGHEEKHVLASGMFPLSYWNPDLMRQRQGIDLQWGSLADLDVTERGVERRRIRGAEIEARRFNMKGTEIRFGKRQAKPWLDVDAWYSPEGKLVAMSFHYRGFDFDYVLQ
jgi:hypothetical protein